MTRATSIHPCILFNLLINQWCALMHFNHIEFLNFWSFYPWSTIEWAEYLRGWYRFKICCNRFFSQKFNPFWSRGVKLRSYCYPNCIRSIWLYQSTLSLIRFLTDIFNIIRLTLFDIFISDTWLYLKFIS
jgi:hypothetical protein